MKKYNYQNNLISKRELKNILGWCFSKYDFMQSANLADDLKNLGFKFACRAGISISIEDLKVPSYKNFILKTINQDILNYEKVYVQGRITNVERYQKIIETWDLTSESLKSQIINYFKRYDPLNSVYIMAFSGARGNFSQVRQLIGMRGLMSSPSGQILNLAIKKNFREGLSVTDYLMSGYGARKGIVDTALKTANSGYLTRRLIDVAQDILIREKDCFTNHSFFITIKNSQKLDWEKSVKKLIGRNLNKPILKENSLSLISTVNNQITENLIKILKQNNIKELYIRSPLTCKLYRSICQNCYGWDLANESLVDIGEAIGILAGQSIGEPGTQLTMRTFHTGGVFQSRKREQIFSPITGVCKFSRFLKTSHFRTNRGEEVVMSKNSGYIILIPTIESKALLQFEIKQDTILFLKDKQYINKGQVVGELIDKDRQFKPDIKAVMCYNSGEMFVPILKNKANAVNQNRLFWLLSGHVYISPPNSFINFYPDCRLNKSSFIYRTKIINNYSGSIQQANFEKNFLDQKIRIKNNFGNLKNSQLQKFKNSNRILNAILSCNNSNYLIPIKLSDKNIFLKKIYNHSIGTILKNSYRTKTGGIGFYKTLCIFNNISLQFINFYKFSLTGQNLNNLLHRYQFRKNNPLIKSPIPVFHQTLIWLEEETEKIDCNEIVILVKNKTFVNKKQLIKSDYLSKSSGLIQLISINDLITTFIIKYGLIYETKIFTVPLNILIYEGECLLKKKLLLCQKKVDNEFDIIKTKILIRPLKCYEFSKINQVENVSNKGRHSFNIFTLFTKPKIIFKPNQLIKTKNSINLIFEYLTYKFNSTYFKNITFNLANNKSNYQVKLIQFTLFCAKQYIPANSNYKNLKSCLLVQKKQFIDKYTIFLFLESITSTIREIIKFKVIHQKIKRILLISNDNCTIVKRNSDYNKKLNDFIINSAKVSQLGKIILKNKNFITIQKGQPYFFPNCKLLPFLSLESLTYRLLPLTQKTPKLKSNRLVYLQKKDLLKASLTNSQSNKENSVTIKKFNFLKLFIKNRGTMHSCLMPQFRKTFLVKKSSSLKDLPFIFESKFKRFLYKTSQTICLKNNDIRNNKLKLKNSFQLIFIKFLEYPFVKSAKSVGFYSISEDYFSREYNSVFCKNKQFIKGDDVVGFLKIEKEIGGDIVQGLPRIEQVLEARKRKPFKKKTPISQRIGLVVQKTSLDFDFKFYKIGVVIKENEKANVHKLLKVYFNYYGRIKYFEKKNLAYMSRLTSNFEGSYKSFKKVQMFILQSVQAIYKSQGVNINDKHLEVIIQQMTTRVLITDEGSTPLLRREILDIYHISYINKIVKDQNKLISYYVPVLFGISKAALNNPSFISAASFQETVKVLTKAGVEGRIDWLRGLKESIIIGKLIPSGTGFRKYKIASKPLIFQLFLKSINSESSLN